MNNICNAVCYFLCIFLLACGGEGPGTDGSGFVKSGDGTGVSFVQDEKLQVFEESLAFDVTATIEKAHDTDVEVMISAVDDTATGGQDYLLPTSIVFAAGQTSVTFQVDLNDDMSKEGAEDFEIVAGFGQDDVESVDTFEVQIQRSDELFLFFSDEYTGDLGGRAGANSKCQNDAPPGLVGLNYHAVLSIDFIDNVLTDLTPIGVTADQRVQDFSGTHVFENWQAVQSNAPLVPISDISLYGNPTLSPFWSGTDPITLENDINCLGFSNDTAGSNGAAGLITNNGIDYYEYTFQCNQAFPILCMAIAP